jgi:serine/threonine protein kinase
VDSAEKRIWMYVWGVALSQRASSPSGPTRQMPSLLERLRDAVAPDLTVERKLGAGGMGVVFLGHDSALDRPVAIKVLRPELATAQAAERFLREARVLAKVRQPGVVPIYQTHEKQGLYFYVMEYLQGETVADRLRRGPLSSPEVLRLGADLLAGLQAVHSLDIVHRDVKPSNIFLLPDRAVLADFGIARPLRDSDSTASAGIVGTVRYMPPEQLALSGVDHRADLYSAAVVLCEALLGSLPAVPSSYRDSIPWVKIPLRFRRSLRRALHSDPEARWPNAAEFRKSLLTRPLANALRGGAGLSALAGITLGVWAIMGAGSQPVLRPADLAVLPFEGAAAGGAGDHLARYTADRLSWFGRWTLQPTGQIFHWAAGVPVLEREDRAARELMAKHYVVGRVVATTGSARLELTIRDSTGKAVNITPIRVAGTLGDMPAWGGAAAESIVTRIFPGFAEEFKELGRHASANSRAYDDYFKGEDAFQRDAYEEAERHYVRALDHDPRFVEAALRLAIVRRFRRVPFEADLKALYERLAFDLPPQHRLLIQALLEPDLTRRFLLYRAAVAAFPRDATVRFVYADELFHRGPLVGVPLDSSLAELTRLIALHPYLEQAPAYDHLLWGQLRLGRENDAGVSLRHRLGINLSQETGEERRRRSFLRLAHDARFGSGFPELKVRYLSIFADSAMLEAVQRYAPLGNAFEIPETQLALGRILARKASSPSARAGGHRAQGLALMLLGRTDEALPHLDTATRLARASDSAIEQAEWRVIPAALGFPQADSAGKRWARALLEALAAGGVLRPRAAWALAVDDSELDGTSMGRWRAALDHATEQDRGARRLRLMLEALIAAGHGLYDSALVLSAPLLAYDSAGVVEDPFARSVLHLKRADWALASGDSAAADRELLWYENTDIGIEGWIQTALQPGEVDAMLSAFARLRRARLAIARGDVKTACPWLYRIGELWRGSDPAFAPLRTEVQGLTQACKS